MKTGWFFLGVALVFSLTLYGCGEPEVYEESIELVETPQIHYHIGMFRGHNPPWVDHSPWIKVVEKGPEGKIEVEKK
jgi:hypothetical protein